ncbi:AlpA family transcriptional regulator [Aggregatibacter actinomycetemcomitans]|uniref:helix-turn-helix transcriptional regulator n=1 Tax=Aggregatibacter actinomycetemcomitans TaxID=714 RepID=UPI00197C9CF3|nr:AlpA family transcriptional regulator [Aggregatibacter actinomycetemcomitans]MBN6075907.1 AlpA family transcriptional regulator [Aggregatibacter actinomycetemcomitans]
MPETTINDRFLRIDEVTQLTGLARTTIYDKTRANTFPRPVDLGGNKKAWLASEVKNWMQERINQRNQKQQRKDSTK